MLAGIAALAQAGQLLLGECGRLLELRTVVFGGRHIKFADANRFLLRGPLGGETRALFFGNLDALTDLGHFRLELLQQMA